MIWSLRALVAAAGLVPWLFALAHERPAAAIALFHGLCHQLPEKTLCVGGSAMLVCSRCAGIYAGAALGAVLRAPRSWVQHARMILLVVAVPLVADVALQAAGAIPVLHATRLATGGLAGWTVSALLFAALRQERRTAGAALSRAAGA